jgi:3D-(3,5/4)-trihydroxycyclohexane-1,2-dione acylhydrolase (decyclizing)
VLDNHGFSSIGGLSQAIGSNDFGADYRCRTASGDWKASTFPSILPRSAKPTARGRSGRDA